jgi:hypothetical protein
MEGEQFCALGGQASTLSLSLTFIRTAQSALLATRLLTPVLLNVHPDPSQPAVPDRTVPAITAIKVLCWPRASAVRNIGKRAAVDYRCRMAKPAIFSQPRACGSG